MLRFFFHLHRSGPFVLTALGEIESSKSIRHFDPKAILPGVCRVLTPLKTTVYDAHTELFAARRFIPLAAKTQSH